MSKLLVIFLLCSVHLIRADDDDEVELVEGIVALFNVICYFIRLIDLIGFFPACIIMFLCFILSILMYDVPKPVRVGANVLATVDNTNWLLS